MTKTIHLIAAARPNFMKIAPLYHALKDQDWCQVKIIHTGQHYDANMSDNIFADLSLPQPHFHLGVGSGTHAEQTGNVMIAYEKICLEEERPDLLVVVGDVNSTAACAMVGTKLHIPTAHLEAGLRSGDRRMPEEINRLVTDAICDYLWTPSPDADENLRREGHPESRIQRLGNIMMDSFEMLRERIVAEDSPTKFGLTPQKYAAVTLHRPSNVDEADTLSTLVDQLLKVAEKLPILFAVHPRTRGSLNNFSLWDTLNNHPNIQLVDPVSYAPFMSLVMNARLIITDSGGIQEESTYLGIPCLTLRENTERPITVTEGTNRLVNPSALLEHVDLVLDGKWNEGQKPDYWDGQTAIRIRELIKNDILAS
ncbi:MAG: UDP-N-acetylglucosamine 2-epimerase (non-hydrolyzing) [Kordiimonas sp.]|nr:UDP-N-acetylglucosamine 2-epimerase (non-hydrolyzing) [Kordiimonas sp.]|tara:strand:- start:149 stop:1252 length:1104 start_codon:yes stop_codon:yes gene_type:complete